MRHDCYWWDELSSQYSPMSEDSEDSRYYDSPLITSMAQPDSLPTSPVSPHRYQKQVSGFPPTTPTTSNPSHGCAAACSQTRQRGSDSEGRFPSSPSDIYHPADLRRAALLRSVQMRAQPPGPPAFESPFSPGQEPMQSIEVEERVYSCVKPLLDERDYQNPQVPNILMEECSSMGISDSQLGREKPCRVLNMNVKGEESGEEVFGGNELGRSALMSSRGSSVLGANAKVCDNFK